MGSALSTQDLGRTSAASAEAIFIISDRSLPPTEADRETILRSWAINDYAPDR